MNKIWLYTLLLFFAACTTGEQESPTDSEVNEDSLNVMRKPPADSNNDNKSSETPRATLQFICRDIGQGMDNPLYEVSLLVGNSYYTLDTIHTCNTIQRVNYDEYEVPEQAMSACGGWWKGSGDYFFAYEDMGDIVVMHAWQTEEQSTQGYFYKEARRLQLPQPEGLQ
jgi:hypothetical protein